MPTLADQEDWGDQGFARRLASWLARQEECGGWDEDWDEEYDWLDDCEERWETTRQERAEQGGGGWRSRSGTT